MGAYLGFKINFIVKFLTGYGVLTNLKMSTKVTSWLLWYKTKLPATFNCPGNFERQKISEMFKGGSLGISKF